MSTRVCTECKQKTNGLTHCTHCNAELEGSPAKADNMSAAERSLDQMVEDASVPSLAQLFRQGKKAGYIPAAIQGYTNGV